MSFYLNKYGILCEVEQVSADRALIYANPGETLDVGRDVYVVREPGQLPKIELNLNDYTEVV